MVNPCPTLFCEYHVTAKIFSKNSFSFKDGAIIEKSDRYEVIREHSDRGFYELLIPEVKMSDAGYYKCVASNKWGEESSDAVLKVTSTCKPHPVLSLHVHF